MPRKHGHETFLKNKAGDTAQLAKQLATETIAAHKEPLSTANEPYDISDDTAN